MRALLRVGLAVALLLILGCEGNHPAGPKVTFRLGGKFCDSYLDSVKSALMTEEGVTAVDLTSRKGHVVVTGDPTLMRSGELKAAINGVKGEGWFCEATLVQ